MVERLKAAIDKAREQRLRQGGGAPVLQAPAGPAGAAGGGADWSRFPELDVDRARMRRERIVASDKSDSAHAAFDVLRTRLMKAMRDNGWTRIGVTSPTQACGKTVISTNLALSVARNSSFRTMLIDVDLRRPSVARCLGARETGPIAAWLMGETPDEEHLRRLSENMIVALNDRRERDSAEVMQSARISENLARSIGALRPDMAIFDLPPLLVSDDAIGFLPNLDGVLLVVASGATHASEIVECEQLLKGAARLLGVVLNKDPSAAPVYDHYYG